MDAISVPNPPSGPVGTASHILFNPSETALFAVFKGGDGVEAGHVYAYPVRRGAVSTTPVINRPADIPVPFSLEFLGSDDTAILTDPTYGYSTVKVTHDFRLELDHKQRVVGQSAECWTAYSADYNTVFVVDGGVPNITLADPATGAITGTIGSARSDIALFDVRLHEQYMYVLGGSPTIVVFDNSPIKSGGLPTIVEEYDITSLGIRDGYMGLAIYPQ